MNTRRALYQARLARWNAAQERARAAYRDLPDACAQMYGATCSNCGAGKHKTCTRAYFDGRRVDCACAREGHERDQ